MKTTWKLIFGFVAVSVLSAVISIGTYSYLNKNTDPDKHHSTSEYFNQGGFRAVGLNYAAENTDFTLAAEQSVNAVVHIKSVVRPSQGAEQYYFNPFEYFFGFGSPRQAPQQRERVGFGSGVIISTDGYIVTNYHVIEGADEIEITTNHNETYTAKLIGGDEATDIALLKMEGKNFPVIPFGDSDALKIGEWVLAVGNPFNLTSTVTAGIVSATGRGLTSGTTRRNPFSSSRDQAQVEKIQSFIQTDAAVNPGNSGGALVNTRGELVGINTMIYSETGNFVGYSFAVPVSIVQKVVADLKQYGMVQRALIGVSIQEIEALKADNPSEYDKLKVHEGVYIAGFSSNSPAKSAGLEVGDVIIGINNSKIRNYTELKAQLSRYSPGDKVDVKVNRAGKERSFTVQLINDQGTTDAIKNQTYEEILGAKFRELSRELQTKAGVRTGVEVYDIKNGKLKDAGIKSGFVIVTANDVRVSSPDVLEAVIKKIQEQDPDDRGLFLRGLYPGGRMEYRAIDLNQFN